MCARAPRGVVWRGAAALGEKDRTSSGGHLVTSFDTFCPTDPMISYLSPFLPSSSRTSIRIRWTWSGK